MPVSLLTHYRFKVFRAVSKLMLYQLTSTADNAAKLLAFHFVIIRIVDILSTM